MESSDCKDSAASFKKGKEKKVAKPSVLSKVQYAAWKAHTKLIRDATSRVDTKALHLLPELYMKSRILEKQNYGAQRQLLENLKLLIKVNRINRQGGWTDCWLLPQNYRSQQKMLKKRKEHAEEIMIANKIFYHRLTHTDAQACHAAQLSAEWKQTLNTIKLMGKFPFCLESFKPIDKGIVDPRFIDIGARKKYWMEFNADGGIHLGNIVIELFEKVCPLTCQIFRKIVRGTPQGEAYSGTKVFMIVPDMFCSVGDVTKNNGFGGSRMDEDLLKPENFTLNHTVPGVLSMEVYNNQISGIFNIIFRAMPFLDGHSVVFGRIVGGSSSILECLSGMGSPLGMTRGNPIISRAGWIAKHGKRRAGRMNSVEAS